ncbi:MAG: T9SS type A sorting domain-containing protein [Flavobacteriales bacterium]|nr:T9SS type A sorting domain-containing protein [Flavobacteriales bacterium]
MTLFPNPNDGTQLNVVLTGIEVYPAPVTVELLDVLGRAVSTQVLQAQDEVLSTVVPLDAQLSAGIYTVRVVTGEMNLTKSVVIER